VVSARQGDYLRTALRVPRDLHDRVVGSSRLTGRSMNAEIIERLDDSFAERVTLRDQFAMAALQGLLATVGETKAVEELKALGHPPQDARAIVAWRHADAMLKARSA
jgi:hypothetical protein